MRHETAESAAGSFWHEEPGHHKNTFIYYQSAVVLAASVSLLLEITYNSIDGHVENSPGSHNIEQSVNVLKNGYHHLVFIFRGRSGDNRIQSVNHVDRDSL